MPERCVAARCNNVGDPKKGISMHKIPFFGEECPIKRKRRKQWSDQLRVGGEEDVGAGEVFLAVLRPLYCGRF